MSHEEEIQQQLIETFPFLAGAVRIQRERRIWADVPLERFMEVFTFTVRELRFPNLIAITGRDDGATFAAVYHLNQDGILLNLSTRTPREDPVLPTITGLFPGSDIYERELEDLFGIKVEGLPKGNRYPLPDQWPAGQYPLRKEWNASSLQEKPEDHHA